jgi:murein DD-endopeptidase MepM/ murein hydrolase activator NlpD
VRKAIVNGVLLCWMVGMACQREPVRVVVADRSSWLESRLAELTRREGVVRFGDTLDGVLSALVGDREIVRSTVAAFSSVYDVRLLKPERRYAFLLDSSGVFQGFEYYADQERLVRVMRDSTGALSARMHLKELVTRVETLRGVVYTTLYDAVKSSGESDELIVAFSDVFQWDIDFFTDPRVGDEFRMVYEKVYVRDPSQPDSLGPLVRYGRVLGGQYILGGTPYTAVYFQKDEKSGGYYDLAGKSFQKTFLKSPLNYRRISSYFSGGRLHPILKIVRAHTGVDFSAAEGTPVSSSADGVVLEKGYNNSIGNFIKIRHRNPHFVTIYGHLRGFAQGMAAGTEVRQRDVIGYVGSTGLSTGPHLHYVFLENGRPLNPLRIKNSSGDPIVAADLPAYEQLKENMVRQLASAGKAGSMQGMQLSYRDGMGLGAAGLPQP